MFCTFASFFNESMNAMLWKAAISIIFPNHFWIWWVFLISDELFKCSSIFIASLPLFIHSKSLQISIKMVIKMPKFKFYLCCWLARVFHAHIPWACMWGHFRMGFAIGRAPYMCVVGQEAVCYRSRAHAEAAAVGAQITLFYLNYDSFNILARSWLPASLDDCLPPGCQLDWLAKT